MKESACFITLKEVILKWDYFRSRGYYLLRLLFECGYTQGRLQFRSARALIRLLFYSSPQSYTSKAQRACTCRATYRGAARFRHQAESASNIRTWNWEKRLYRLARLTPLMLHLLYKLLRCNMHKCRGNASWSHSARLCVSIETSPPSKATTIWGWLLFEEIRYLDSVTYGSIFPQVGQRLVSHWLSSQTFLPLPLLYTLEPIKYWRNRKEHHHKYVEAKVKYTRSQSSADCI